MRPREGEDPPSRSRRGPDINQPRSLRGPIRPATFRPPRRDRLGGASPSRRRALQPLPARGVARGRLVSHCSSGGARKCAASAPRGSRDRSNRPWRCPGAA